MNTCEMCPRKCKVNRKEKLGFCKATDKIEIAKFYLHKWEEPSISGKCGSGTVFFNHCNLQCVYCQNYKISSKQKGMEVTPTTLAYIFLYLQNQKASNINLVTPTHYIDQIKEAILLARKKGLSIPIVYNTSGYENVESLKKLEGLIDVYLTDFKYYDDKYAKKYSNVENYVSVCKDALKEMYRQVQKNKFEKDIMVKGIIVRHLILPNLTSDSKKILSYLYETYKDNIYISIMNQYTPLKNVEKYKELNRTIKKEEYLDVLNYALDIGVCNAYVQEEGTEKESFIPDFNLEETKKDIDQITDKI